MHVYTDICACIMLDVCLYLQTETVSKRAVREGEGSYKTYIVCFTVCIKVVNIRQMNVGRMWGCMTLFFSWCTVSVMKIMFSLVETIYAAN